MLPHAPLDDLREVFQARTVPTCAILAKRLVVRDVGSVSAGDARALETGARVFVSSVFQVAARAVHEDVGVVRGTLREVRATLRHLILLERDVRQKTRHLRLEVRVVDGFRGARGIRPRASLEQALRVVQLDRRVLRPEARQALVHLRGEVKLAEVVVAVAQDG